VGKGLATVGAEILELASRNGYRASPGTLRGQPYSTWSAEDEDSFAALCVAGATLDEFQEAFPHRKKAQIRRKVSAMKRAGKIAPGFTFGVSSVAGLRQEESSDSEELEPEGPAKVPEAARSPSSVDAPPAPTSLMTTETDGAALPTPDNAGTGSVASTPQPTPEVPQTRHTAGHNRRRNQ